MDMKGGMCGCSHHKIMPILVILFGLLFLLGSFDVVTTYTVGMIWPILVIIGGFTKLSGRMCKCNSMY